MKRVLIISPYFPPCNAADMQRVRMSLPFFRECGWDAEVVMVDERYTDIKQDELLLQSIPAGIKIHKVAAFDKKWTSKLGLGSIALRSFRFYKKYVDRLLKNNKFDLIYFSTTQFPVCVLGAHWKKRFGVPYVIDMQDPWHSDYYRDKPRHERPRKYWFSYRLNKNMEPIAMQKVGGLISVSPKYITDLRARYPRLNELPASVITFGAFEKDLAIAVENAHQFKKLLPEGYKNIVYIGRGGADMEKALTVVFKALKKGLEDNPEVFGRLRIHFLGTSYAPAGKGVQTIKPLANQLGVGAYVNEQTDRIAYYHTLATLMQADALVVPGSDDAGYTASKLYPYLLTQKPMLAVLHPQSPANGVLAEYKARHVFHFNDDTAVNGIVDFLENTAMGTLDSPAYDEQAIKKYSAENMTRLQCQLFAKVIDEKA